MKRRSLEIHCTACGADTLVKREPVYDGFTKTGEVFRCISCGHTFADEDDVPFNASADPKVFGEEDRSKTIDVFKDDEKGRNCRHCRHYVVNPFTQRCGVHEKEVEATDFCDQFEPPDRPPPSI